jgi:hypothetical protein
LTKTRISSANDSTPSFCIIRRRALSLLKNESTLKVGIKNKRLTAGWDETFLEKSFSNNDLWCNRPVPDVLLELNTIIELTDEPK